MRERPDAGFSPGRSSRGADVIRADASSPGGGTGGRADGLGRARRAAGVAASGEPPERSPSRAVADAVEPPVFCAGHGSAHHRGRLFSEAGARPPAKSVALSVPSFQAASIAEDWTDSGNMSFRTAVRTARWKKTENQDMADRLARHLDVAEKSGQILAQEPAAEVQLRDLAAIWWADQHPKDLETAEYFRESSNARWGTSADMWREAREFRKLSQGVKSD